MNNQFILVNRQILAIPALLLLAVLVAYKPLATSAVLAGLVLLIYARNRFHVLSGSGLLVIAYVPLLLLLVVLSTIGFVEMSNGFIELLKETGAGQRLYGTLAYFTFVILCVDLAKRSIVKLDDNKFIAALIFSSILLRTLYVYFVDIVQVSDFAGMANAAVGIATNGLGASLHNADFIYQIYAQRTIFYLVPFNVLLGDSAIVIPLANMMFISGTLYCVFKLVKLLFKDAAIARITVVVASFAPETFLVTNVATHDVPGAFWLVVNLLVLSCLFKSEKLNWSTAGLLALLLLSVFMVEMQRSVGIFVGTFDGLILAMMFKKGSQKVENIIPLVGGVIVVIFGLYMAIGVTQLMQVHTEKPGQHLPSYLMAHTDPSSDGSYGYWQGNWEKVKLSDEGGRYVIKRLIAGVTMNPSEYIPMFVRKSSRLSLLGTQHRFYLNGATVAGDPMSFEARRQVYFVMNAYAALFWLAFSIGIMLAVRGCSEVVIPGLFLGSFVLFLLVFSEVQPRYIHFIWYLGASYVAMTLLRVFPVKREIATPRMMS